MKADITGGREAEYDPRNLVDYEVFDRNNESIGDVSALWLGDDNEPSYIGVQTTWLIGRHHVVPTYGADVNHHSQVIRLPYSEDDVKNAPTHDAGADLEVEEEQEILSYYRSRGGKIPEERARSEFTGPRSVESGARRTATESDVEMPLHEEKMSVGKRQVEAGGVRLRKIVRTETVQQPVELSHEDVVLERVPGKGGEGARGRAFEAEDIYIPLRREEAVVRKDTSLREQVRVRKESRPEDHTVSGEVRKEDVDIEDTRGKRNR